MLFDHLGRLAIGFEALLLEATIPAPEGGQGAAFGVLAPKLAEGLLEHVGGVQAFVGCQQLRQCLAALERNVLVIEQQRVILALDVGAVLAHGCNPPSAPVRRRKVSGSRHHLVRNADTAVPIRARCESGRNHPTGRW